jgi:hypothetical protein
MYIDIFRKSLLVLALFSSAVLVGCASFDGDKYFGREQLLPKSGVAYGQVGQVFTSQEFEKFCKSEVFLKWNPNINCHDQTKKIFAVNLVRKNGTYSYSEAVQKSIPVETGAIVKLDMSKERGTRFIDVVSHVETPTCKWVQDGGLNRNQAKVAGGGVGIAAALLAAPVLLPLGVVGVVKTGNAGEGGVECDGWSYRSTFKDLLASN